MSADREIRDYLNDILESVREIREFTGSLSFDEFKAQKKTVNAVIRSLEVMGEAVKKIPPELREKHPALPWNEIAGMRDKLIHEYFGVDLEIVWETVTQDLAAAEKAVEDILTDLQ